MPWQEWALDYALAYRADGKWSAFEVCLLIARQNGKGGVLEALELAHLFLLGSRKIIHSAHRQDTALDAQVRLWTLISQTPKLLAKVKGQTEGNGKEGITLRGGAQIRFKTRTKDGGRGLAGDLVILDEAMDLPATVMRALVPTMRARTKLSRFGPQLWYVGSPVDQEKDRDGATLADVRARGIEGDPRLAFMEWSAGEWEDFLAGRIDLDDPKFWAMGNASLGYLIELEHMENERRAFRADKRGFVIELLGVGDWPIPQVEEPKVIDFDTWESRKDERSQIVGPLTLAIEMDWRTGKSGIEVAGTRADGRSHIEVIEHELASTEAVVARVLGLLDQDPDAVVIDERSPATVHIPALEEAGLEVTRANTENVKQGTALVLNKIKDDTLRHVGQDELDAAVQAADTRPIGDLAVWERKSGPIAPLVGCSLALQHHLNRPMPKPPPAPPVSAPVTTATATPTAGLATAGF